MREKEAGGAPRVSLVIPAFREEERLPRYFPELAAALADLPVGLLVVDDGSPAASFAALKAALTPHLGAKHRVLRHEINRGKGAAIAFGLEHAGGEFFGFVDADGSIPAAEVRRFLLLGLERQGWDMLLGSRVKMLGRSVERSFWRHLTGRVFATMLSESFSIPVYDSQCGLKMFRSERYRAVKGLLTDQRWVWDSQLVILFHRRGWRVEEVPIDWHDTPGSKIRVVRDGLRMWAGLRRFRRHNP